MDEKIAVITGGSSCIGLATAQRFVEEGAYVFIAGRRQSEVDAAVKQIAKNVTGRHGKQQKGRIDVLFANAGSRAIRNNY